MATACLTIHLPVYLPICLFVFLFGLLSTSSLPDCPTPPRNLCSFSLSCFACLPLSCFCSCLFFCVCPRVCVGTCSRAWVSLCPSSSTHPCLPTYMPDNICLALSLSADLHYVSIYAIVTHQADKRKGSSRHPKVDIHTQGQGEKSGGTRKREQEKKNEQT